MKNKIVKIDENFALLYTNFRIRKQTNEERYEGYMRADFTSHKVPDFDSVEVVRINGA